MRTFDLQSPKNSVSSRAHPSFLKQQAAEPCKTSSEPKNKKAEEQTLDEDEQAEQPLMDEKPSGKHFYTMRFDKNHCDRRIKDLLHAVAKMSLDPQFGS